MSRRSPTVSPAAAAFAEALRGGRPALNARAFLREELLDLLDDARARRGTWPELRTRYVALDAQIEDLVTAKPTAGPLHTFDAEGGRWVLIRQIAAIIEMLPP